MSSVELPEKLPPIVGLTGSIGCGKSAVSSILKEKGIPVIDADVLAREVVAPGMPALAEIESQFGSEFIEMDGSLNRKLLGRTIFEDLEKRRLLEKITHPHIRARYAQSLKELAADPTLTAPFVLYVVPLLFESNFTYDELVLVVVVSAPPDICVERIMARDECTKEFAQKKLASQIPIAEKRARADVVIDNSGTLDELGPKVDSAYSQVIHLLTKAV